MPVAINPSAMRVVFRSFTELSTILLEARFGGTCCVESCFSSSEQLLALLPLEMVAHELLHLSFMLSV